MDQRKQTRDSRERTETQRAPQGGPAEASPLLQEVSGWGRAAADALARSRRAGTAERELERRHNTGGE